MKPAAAWAGLSAGLLALGLYPVLIHTAVVSGAGTGPATVFVLIGKLSDEHASSR